MKTHLPWKELGYALGGLVLLLALYVGGYATLMTPTPVEKWVDEDLTPNASPKPSPTAGSGAAVTYIWHGVKSFKKVRRFVPKYAGAHAVVAGFFDPIHEVDRRLRPDFWKEEEVPGALLP